MESYLVDCRTVTNFDEFVEAINVGLVRHSGGEWDGNLDAFNDYLSWPSAGRYALEILGSANCAARLGHAAMARKLSQMLETCHSTNRPGVEARLQRARQELGQTLFDLVLGIVQSNAHVSLVLR